MHYFLKGFRHKLYFLNSQKSEEQPGRRYHHDFLSNFEFYSRKLYAKFQLKKFRYMYLHEFLNLESYMARKNQVERITTTFLSTSKQLQRISTDSCTEILIKLYSQK